MKQSLSRLLASSTRSGVVNGPWKRKPKPKSSFKPVEIEIGRARGHLAGIVEERQVEVAVDHDAPLRLQQQAVPVAEPPAAVAAQRGAAANRRQHEERSLLAVLARSRSARGRGTRAPTSRAGSAGAAMASYSSHLEAEVVVWIAVVVKGGAEKAAAARVAWRRAPVDADRALACAGRSLPHRGPEGPRACTWFPLTGRRLRPGCCVHRESSTPPRSIRSGASGRS